jgi:hypothetical protein
MGIEQTPRHLPWNNYNQWVPHSWRRKESKNHGKNDKGARRIERDPNHPRWSPRYAQVSWWGVKIRLLGTDPEGRQNISITKGLAEPVYVRVGSSLEVFKAGKKLG